MAKSRIVASLVSLLSLPYGTTHCVANGKSHHRLISKLTCSIAGIWLGLRELGQLIGASIQLSLNVRSSSRGKVGYTTYIVLIALQCLGLPLALVASPPEKVIHSDGTRGRVVAKNTTLKEEMRKTWNLLKRKQMFLLVPILIGFQWNTTYLGIYMTK